MNNDVAFVEGVLRSGAAVATVDQSPHIQVVAEDALRRHVEIGTSEIDINLRPRSRRWMGMLGAYMPSRDLTIDEGKYAGWSLGFAESQLHFRDRSHFESWLQIAPSFTPFYGDKGLLPRYAIFPKSRTLRIEMLRVRIDDDIAEWDRESKLKVTGDLVEVSVPKKTSGFHSEPPTLEELKRRYEERDPFDIFKD